MQTDLARVIQSYREGGSSAGSSWEDADVVLKGLDRAERLALKKALLDVAPTPIRKDVLKAWSSNPAVQVQVLLEILSGNAQHPTLPGLPIDHPGRRDLEKLRGHVVALELRERNGARPEELLREAKSLNFTFAIRFATASLDRDLGRLIDGQRKGAYAFAAEIAERVAQVHKRASAQMPESKTIIAIRDAIREGRYGPEDLRRDFDARDYYERSRFIEQVFGAFDRTAPTEPGEPGFLPYTPSPIDTMFEICEKLVPPGKVLCDCGSGLGLLVLLQSFLKDAPAMGVEFDPAYVAHSKKQAELLGLSKTAFEAGDARHADYEKADVFYFFNPFTGDVMTEVLARLKEVARKKPITILSTSAPITGDWLVRESTTTGVVVFKSKPPSEIN